MAYSHPHPCHLSPLLAPISHLTPPSHPSCILWLHLPPAASPFPKPTLCPGPSSALRPSPSPSSCPGHLPASLLPPRPCPHPAWSSYPEHPSVPHARCPSTPRGGHSCGLKPVHHLGFLPGLSHQALGCPRHLQQNVLPIWDVTGMESAGKWFGKQDARIAWSTECGASTVSSGIPKTNEKNK